MQIYIAHLLTEWLNHATHGVNALLPLVPRIGTDPAPPVTAFANGFRASDAAQVKAPEASGAMLQVLSGLRASSRRNPGVQPGTDMQTWYAFRYIAAKTADVPLALRQTSYTMTALDLSVIRLFTTAPGEVLRQQYVTLYGVQLISAGEIELDVGYVSETDNRVAFTAHLPLNQRFLHS